MAPKIKSLKTILEKYMTSETEPTERLEFGEYKTKRAPDQTPVYSKGINEAYIKSKLGEDRGALTEKAYSGGYLGSGYKEYLEKKAEEKRGLSIEEINARQERDESRAYSGYLSYLREYESGQKTLSSEVKDSLIKEGVADPHAAYSYAISMGLDKESAKDVSVAVYEVMRDMVISSIAKDIATLKVSKEGAIALAKSYGLIDEDINYVRQLADERYSVINSEYHDGFESSALLDEYLKGLENKAGKITP